MPLLQELVKLYYKLQRPHNASRVMALRRLSGQQSMLRYVCFLIHMLPSSFLLTADKQTVNGTFVRISLYSVTIIVSIYYVHTIHIGQLGTPTPPGWPL